MRCLCLPDVVRSCLAITLALTVVGSNSWAAEPAGQPAPGGDATASAQVQPGAGSSLTSPPHSPATADTGTQEQSVQPPTAPSQAATAAQPVQASKPAVPVPARALPVTAPKPAVAPAKPTVLYGRIEEISLGPGARLPVKLRALTPKLDTSGQLKGKAQTIMGRVVGSFPIDWRGDWSGTLTVHAAVFDPIRWQFDPQEANRERELLRPGTQGTVTFRFSTGKSGQIRLEPASVVFSAPMDRSRYAQMLNQLQTMLMGGQAVPGGSGAIMLQGLPYLYALHLGDLENGVGVTGNQLQSRVVRNDITELAPGVLEQVVVTYNLVRNPTTGKSRYGYSENVVRFTRQTSNKLYVQAATVSYLSNGRFEDKTILYGMVTRGQGTGSANPLDGLMPGWSFPQ